MKLIDKDALVAEIEKLINEIYNGQPFDSLSREKQVALWYVKSIMSSVNSLEVKEVDLDAEIAKWEESFKHCPASMGYKETAKHFFELGLKTQHSELTWEDISVLRKIMAEYRRQTSNEMLVLNDEDYCKEVLNRFKTQKG